MKLRARRRQRMLRAAAPPWRLIAEVPRCIAVDLGRPGGDRTCEAHGRLLDGQVVEITSMVFR